MASVADSLVQADAPAVDFEADVQRISGAMGVVKFLLNPNDEDDAMAKFFYLVCMLYDFSMLCSEEKSDAICARLREVYLDCDFDVSKLGGDDDLAVLFANHFISRCFDKSAHEALGIPNRLEHFRCIVNTIQACGPTGTGAETLKHILTHIVKAQAEPEQVQAEPEQVQAEPEQVQAEPEQVQAEPEQVQAEPEQVQAEPEQDTSEQLPAPIEQAQAEPEAEPVQQVAAEEEPVQAEPEQAEPEQEAAPEVVEEANVEPQQVKLPEPVSEATQAVSVSQSGSMAFTRRGLAGALNVSTAFDF